MKFQGLTKFFILAAIVTLFLRRDIVLLIKPFEILMLFGFLFFVLSFIFKEEGLDKLKQFFFQYLSWIKIFALAFIFIIIGTLNGIYLYWENIDQEILIRILGGFAYFGINTLTFFLILYYGKEQKFTKNLLLAFYSSLIFIPFSFLPRLAEKFSLINEGLYFYGLHKNPTTFAFFLFFSLVLIIIAYIKTAELLKKFFYWLMATLILTLMIWSGSRSGWLVAFITMIWVSFYLYRFHYDNWAIVNKIKKVVFFIIAANSALFIAFSILPHYAKIMALDRIYPQISNNFPSIYKFEQISFKNALTKISNNPVPTLPYQSRESLWPQSAQLFLKNPLGLGVEYFRYIKSINQGGYVTHSHNTLLQAGLTGGIGLLLVYIFIHYKIIKIFWILKKDNEWLMLSTMIIGVFIFSLIGEFLYIVPWPWVIISLVAAKEKTKN